MLSRKVNVMRPPSGGPNGFGWKRRVLALWLATAVATGVWAGTPPKPEVRPVRKAVPAVPAADEVLLPASVPDPLEPMNRVIWSVNQGVMTGLIKPTSKVYRFIVIKPVRTGIRNFGRNILYPGRLLNHVLQGRWEGARDESYRFLCNTVVGLGGVFDVASHWNIPTSNADFGQTFGQWGWKPQFYLMLPIGGPSNDRDATGLIADAAANPLTYFPPYSYYTYGVTYNNLSEGVDEYVRLARTEKDPYSMLQYAWTFAREYQVARFEVRGEQDPAALETLQSVFFTFKDRDFPDRGRTRSALIPSTGRRLKYTYWLQNGRAPVVYIVPGLGSHRLAETALALAELAYQKGFSVVCVSSVYNYEFMERASSAALPAYTPVDGHDLHVALTEIDRRMATQYPSRLGARALMGYSMGAFHSLYVAAQNGSTPSSLLQFDRVVGINAPVRLFHGISKLDEFFQAPLAWPAGDRTASIEQTFLKVAAIGKGSLTPSATLPFNAVESRFLIGLTFRFILRDVIYSSQQRTNQGVLQHPIKKLRRGPLYQEILHYSYKDYFEKFVVPYYRQRGVELSATDALERASDLRTYAAGLQKNPRVRLIVNRNDFLLGEGDLAWLQATFGPERLTVFERGGHLGNLADPLAQQAILNALDGLSPADGEAGLTTQAPKAAATQGSRMSGYTGRGALRER